LLRKENCGSVEYFRTKLCNVSWAFFWCVGDKTTRIFAFNQIVILYTQITLRQRLCP